MKIYASIFFATLFFSLLLSCDKEEIVPTNELIGSWRLIEVYGDPGDGSGDFEAVESNKQLTFFEDNTLLASGNLCNFSITSDIPQELTYDPATKEIATDCNFSFPISYEIIDSKLVLAYPCIESCLERYVKIDR